MPRRIAAALGGGAAGAFAVVAILGVIVSGLVVPPVVYGLFFGPGDRRTACGSSAIHGSVRDRSSPATMHSFLVQDRFGRVWGTVHFADEYTETNTGRFQPTPDYDYLRGRFEQYETELAGGLPDAERLGDQYGWMVSLRPRLVAVDGADIELLCAFVTRREDELWLTAVPQA